MRPKRKIKNLLVSFCDEYNQQVKPEDRLELVDYRRLGQR